MKHISFRRILAALVVLPGVLLLTGCPSNVFYGLDPEPIDSDGPDIDIINPKDNQAVSGTIFIIGTSTDKYQVSSMELKIDDGSFVSMQGTYTWSTRVDTTTLAIGNHTLTIRGTDKFGNSSVVTRKINVDQDIPGIAFDLDLESNQNYIRGTGVVLHGTADDNTGVSQVQLSWNGGLTWITANLSPDDNPSTTDRLEYTWTVTVADTADVPFSGDGLYTPLVRAIDDAGLIGTTGTAIYVDNTPPAFAAIASPANNMAIRPSVDLIDDLLVVAGTVTDAAMANSVHLREVQVQVGTLPVVRKTGLGTLNPVSFSIPVDISSIRNSGLVGITVTVQDRAGNTAVRNLNVALDDTPPYFTGAIARDAADGTAFDGMIGTGSPGRQHYIGTNNLLNTFTGKVTVDAPGSISDVSSITIRLIHDGSSVVLDSRVNNGVLTGEPGGLPDGAGNFSHSLDFAGFPNGTYTLEFKVASSRGSFSTLSRTLVVDKSAPVVTVNDPESGQLVSGTAVLISGSADGGHAPIYSVRIRINDGMTDTSVWETNVLAVSPGFAGIGYSDGYFSYAWNTTAPHNYNVGEHLVEILAEDMAGNTGTASVNPIKDPNAPSVAVTLYSHPTNPLYTDQPMTPGRAVNGSGTIKGTAADPDGIASVSISLNGGVSWNNPTTVTPPPGAASVDWTYTLPNLSAGTRTIQVRAVDGSVGAAASYTTMSVLVDNTAPTLPQPTLSRTDSLGNPYWHGVVRLAGTCSDSETGILDVAAVVYESGAGAGEKESLTVDGTTSYAADWDTEALPTVGSLPIIVGDGITIQVRATDRAGNFSLASLTNLTVKPYVISVSETEAALGQTNIMLTGHNFTSTAALSVGGGSVTVTGRSLAVNPNTMTFTVPGTGSWTGTYSGPKSGPVIVNAAGSTNNLQVPVKMDLFYTETLIGADSPLYPSITFSGNYYRLGFAASQGTNRYLRYQSQGNPANPANPALTPVSDTGGNRPSHVALAHHASAQYMTYYINGLLRIIKSVNDFTSTEPGFPKTLSNSSTLYTDVKVSPTDANLVHVVFKDSSGNVQYMRSTDGFATVPASVSLGGDGSGGDWLKLAIGFTGNPHVVWRQIMDVDGTNTSVLRYTRFNGISWIQPVTIDRNNAGNFGNGLVVGSDGSVHISYYDGNSGDLMYARANANPSTAGAFTITRVDAPGIAGWFSNLALDSFNQPHIAYLDFTSGKTRYSRKVGGTWKAMTVADANLYSLNGNSNYTGIAVDTSGFIHIAYSTGAGLRRSIYLPEE